MSSFGPIACGAFALAVFSTACGARNISIRNEPPADSDWWAAVVTSGGAFAGASSLMSTDDGPPYRVSISYADADRLSVLAYRTEDLEVLSGFPPSSSELNLSLKDASDSGGRLPEASYAAHYTLDGEALDDGAPSPEISAPWLDPCPRLIPAGEAYPVHEDCFELPCKTVARQDQCTLTFDVLECSTPGLQLQLDATGSGEFSSSVYDDCRTMPPSFDGVLATNCFDTNVLRRCHWEVITSPLSEEPPAFTVERIRIEDEVPPIAADDWTQPRALNDLAIIDERVYVSRFVEPTSYVRCLDTATEIFVFDDAMQEVDRFAGLPCLTQLEADPSTATLIGTHYDAAADRHYLSRFALDGTVVATATITEGGEGRRLDIAISLEREEVAVTVGALLEGVTIFFHALDTLQQIPASAISSAAGYSGLVAANGDFSAISNRSDQLFRDIRTRNESFLVREVCGRGNLARLAYSAATDRYVITTKGAFDGLFALDVDRMDCKRFKAIESASHPDDFVISPRNPSQVVVGLDQINAESDLARIAIADLSLGRFLTGSQVVGRGIVEALKVDANDTIWAILPYESTLLRIELE